MLIKELEELAHLAYKSGDENLRTFVEVSVEKGDAGIPFGKDVKSFILGILVTGEYEEED